MFSHATNQKTLCYHFFLWSKYRWKSSWSSAMANIPRRCSLRPHRSFFTDQSLFFWGWGMFLIFPSSWWIVNFLANSIGRSSSLKSHSKFCFGSVCFTLWWFSWWIRDSELHFNTETLPILGWGNAGAGALMGLISLRGTISFKDILHQWNLPGRSGTIRVKQLNWFSKLKCIIH